MNRERPLHNLASSFKAFSYRVSLQYFSSIGLSCQAPHLPVHVASAVPVTETHPPTLLGLGGSIAAATNMFLENHWDKSGCIRILILQFNISMYLRS